MKSASTATPETIRLKEVEVDREAALEFTSVKLFERTGRRLHQGDADARYYLGLKHATGQGGREDDVIDGGA